MAMAFPNTNFAFSTVTSLLDPSTTITAETTFTRTYTTSTAIGSIYSTAIPTATSSVAAAANTSIHTNTAGIIIGAIIGTIGCLLLLALIALILLGRSRKAFITDTTVSSFWKQVAETPCANRGLTREVYNAFPISKCRPDNIEVANVRDPAPGVSGPSDVADSRRPIQGSGNTSPPPGYSSIAPPGYEHGHRRSGPGTTVNVAD